MSKKKFKDTAGREYKIKVTIPKLRWIRDEIDVDLGQRQAFIELSNNPIDLVNVLYMLVKEQCDEYKISDVEFGESLDGDTLEKAWEAFGESYLSFCPSHRAEALRAMMAASKKAERLTEEAIDKRLDQLVELYSLAYNSPESSESSRPIIPLGN